MHFFALRNAGFNPIFPMAKERTNPFYVALLIAGIAFAVTACAYAMMIVVKQRGGSNGPEHPLINLMEEQGLVILLVELGLLTVFTFAAIGTDEWWQGTGDKTKASADKSVAEENDSSEKR